MNERAASGAAGRRSLWHVGEDVSTFVGPLARNALHTHSVPVLLTAPYGRFQFRTEAGSWTVCQSALVPAGRRYEFDMAGEPLSVIYLEPSLAGRDALSRLMTADLDSDGVLVGSVGHGGLLRELYEDHRSGGWAGEALLDLMRFGNRGARNDLDRRIVGAVRGIQCHAASNVAVDDFARAAGLSASRFQHLFTREVGVPYRRYRAWRRMLLAIREITNGARLTDAAHAAGYADQSHFAREFRRSFGASASAGIAGARG